MIQEKMNVLEQVGLSESNLSENAVNASFHLKVRSEYKHTVSDSDWWEKNSNIYI